MTLRTGLIIVFSLLASLLGTSAQQCGRQAGYRRCANGLCCSQYGYCGRTPAYCGAGCQSQCGSSLSTPTTTANGVAGAGDVSSIVTKAQFDEMLKYRNDPRCESKGFYTYEGFIDAARSFDGFGTSGDVNTRKRELAAFLAQTSHQTNGRN